MKTKLFSLLALMVVAIAATGCKKDAANTNEIAIVVSATEFLFPVNGGEAQTLEITTTAQWEIAVTNLVGSDNAEWLEISEVSGAGNHAVTLVALANPAITQRSLTLVVSSPNPGVRPVEIEVVQTQSDATLIVRQVNVNFYADSETLQAIEVKSNTAWEVTTQDDWVNIETKSGQGDGEILVGVDFNMHTEFRSGEITVTAGDITKTVRVSQQGQTGVEIVEFKDKDFLVALLALGTVDRDQDGQISFTEVYETQYLDISNKGIADISEIEYFSQLVFLKAGGNLLVDVDLSKCHKLMEVDLSGNSIEQIDLSQNTELTALVLNKNKISSIDLQNNTKLKILNLDDNRLTKLSVAGLIELQQLEAAGNEITEIDIAEQTKLTMLRLNSNKLSSISIFNNPLISELAVGNQVGILTCYVVVSAEQAANTSLFQGELNHKITTDTIMQFQDPVLAEILQKYDTNNDGVFSASEAAKITEIVIENSEVATFLPEELAYFENLEKLVISGSKIQQIDLSTTPNLKSLDLSKNYLRSLDITALSNLGKASVVCGQQIDITDELVLVELELKVTAEQFELGVCDTSLEINSKVTIVQ